ncbi:MAG: acyl-CoA-binding protein [bacterium]
MENLKSLFEAAKKDVEMLTERPSNETLLLLYALYKQATEGDNNNDEPQNPFDFVAKAKYEAWISHKGKSTDQAMQEYIDRVDRLRA